MSEIFDAKLYIIVFPFFYYIRGTIMSFLTVPWCTDIIMESFKNIMVIRAFKIII